MNLTREHASPEKFTRYYNIIEACGRKGCPVCNLIAQGVDRYIDHLLYENVNDPEIRKALRSSQGICVSHADTLLRAGDTLGISILYEDIIREVQALMARRSARALNPSQPCPVCRFRLSAEDNYLNTIARHIGERELMDALGKSSGLCLVHLRMLYGRLRNKRARRQLCALHAEKLGRLRAHMREFIRKHDMQFSNETISEVERESCVAAINTLVGMSA